jgi:Protein of unknown function (DUF4238)
MESLSRRNKLAFYAALLFCRATQRRRRSEKTWEKLQQEFAETVEDDEYIADLCLHYSQRFDTPVSADKIKKRLRELSQQMKSSVAVNNNFVEDLLAVVEPLKTVLLQKPWQIWRAPEGLEFVTSDNPLISFVPMRNGQLNPGHGFRKDGVIGAFPLAPSACLGIGVRGCELVTLNAADIARINVTVIRLCDRYVYSKTFSPEIQKLVDAYGGDAKYGKNAFLPLGMHIPTAKEFLRHSLGLSSEAS